MNVKTERQIENLKKQTIGVEIEMNHITRERAARLAADHFGTGRYEYTASRNGYSTWSAWDAQGREWKFQKDVSIAGCDAEKCELVTPILKYEDIETLQEPVLEVAPPLLQERKREDEFPLKQHWLSDHRVYPLSVGDTSAISFCKDLDRKSVV